MTKHTTDTKGKRRQARGLGALNLRVALTNEEILADLRYPSRPGSARRPS